MPAQGNWESVPKVAGLYRKLRADGTYAWRFRMPRERNWTTNNDGLGLDEAKRWRNKLLGDPQVRVIATRQTFFEYVTEWANESNSISEGTRKRYHDALRLHLKPLHHLKLQEVTPNAIRGTIAYMRETNGLAGATIAANLVPGRAAMTTAAARGLIATNPFKSLEEREVPRGQKRRKRILTPDQTQRLVMTAPGQLRPIIGILMFAGLRHSEALGLWWSDIDFQKNTIHVWKQLAGDEDEATIEPGCRDLKGEGATGEIKERRVEMPGVLRSLLIEHRGDRITQPKEFLFLNGAGNPMTRNAVGRLFKKHVDALGLGDEPAFIPHQCRHNYASALIASGADVGFVADQLGHSNPVITLTIYRHEFRAARAAGAGAAAIDAIYGKAMGNIG